MNRRMRLHSNACKVPGERLAFPPDLSGQSSREQGHLPQLDLPIEGSRMSAWTAVTQKPLNAVRKQQGFLLCRPEV